MNQKGKNKLYDDSCLGMLAYEMIIILMGTTNSMEYCSVQTIPEMSVNSDTLHFFFGKQCTTATPPNSNLTLKKKKKKTYKNKCKAM